MNFAFFFTPCADRADAAFEIMLAPLPPACGRSRAQMRCCLTRHDILCHLPQFSVLQRTVRKRPSLSRYRQSYMFAGNRRLA
jgi:hypothetical protein